jgi:hypothetical protein
MTATATKHTHPVVFSGLVVASSARLASGEGAAETLNR